MKALFTTRMGKVACLIISAALAWVVTEHLMITTTPSLSERVFWKSRVRSEIKSVKTGGFVVFDMYLPEPKGETRSLIKRVGCSAGETLKVTGDDYYCNDRYIGKAKHKTLMGSPLTPFVYNGPVPEGKVFAVGDHKDSYDSRYWGFLDLDKVEARAWAIPL